MLRYYCERYIKTTNAFQELNSISKHVYLCMYIYACIPMYQVIYMFQSDKPGKCEG